MSMFLESVTLNGEHSTDPLTPNRKIAGAFYAEPNALVFKSKSSSFSVAVAWEQVKEAYVYWDDPGLTAFVSWMFTLGIINPHDYYIRLTFYDAAHDQDISLDFYVATSNGTLRAERRAITLAKSIWKLRSEYINLGRSRTAIRVRGR